MPFKPGNPGKPVGALNKRTQLAKEILDRAGFSPVENLMELVKIAMTKFTEEDARVESGCFSPMESNAAAYLKMAIDATKELASFVHPKLKAVEQTQAPSPLDGMTAEQKLQAMKEAVKALQAQVKAEG